MQLLLSRFTVATYIRVWHLQGSSQENIVLNDFFAIWVSAFIYHNATRHRTSRLSHFCRTWHKPTPVDPSQLGTSEQRRYKIMRKTIPHGHPAIERHLRRQPTRSSNCLPPKHSKHLIGRLGTQASRVISNCKLFCRSNFQEPVLWIGAGKANLPRLFWLVIWRHVRGFYEAT